MLIVLVVLIGIVSFLLYGMHLSQQKVRDLCYMEAICRRRGTAYITAQELASKTHTSKRSASWFLVRRLVHRQITMTRSRGGNYKLLPRGKKRLQHNLAHHAGYTPHPLID